MQKGMPHARMSQWFMFCHDLPGLPGCICTIKIGIGGGGGLGGCTGRARFLVFCVFLPRFLCFMADFFPFSSSIPPTLLLLFYLSLLIFFFYFFFLYVLHSVIFFFTMLYTFSPWIFDLSFFVPGTRARGEGEGGRGKGASAFWKEISWHG